MAKLEHNGFFGVLCYVIKKILEKLWLGIRGPSVSIKCALFYGESTGTGMPSLILKLKIF